MRRLLFRLTKKITSQVTHLSEINYSPAGTPGDPRSSSSSTRKWPLRRARKLWARILSNHCAAAAATAAETATYIPDFFVQSQKYISAVAKRNWVRGHIELCKYPFGEGTRVLSVEESSFTPLSLHPTDVKTEIVWEDISNENFA